MIQIRHAAGPGLLVAVAGSSEARPDTRMHGERAESTLCGVADLSYASEQREGTVEGLFGLDCGQRTGEGS